MNFTLSQSPEKNIHLELDTFFFTCLTNDTRKKSSRGGAPGCHSNALWCFPVPITLKQYAALKGSGYCPVGATGRSCHNLEGRRPGDAAMSTTGYLTMTSTHPSCEVVIEPTPGLKFIHPAGHKWLEYRVDFVSCRFHTIIDLCQSKQKPCGWDFIGYMNHTSQLMHT